MTASLHQRFEQKVRRTEGCWLWAGALGGGNGDGRYGQIKHEGKVLRAHRVSYELHRASIPVGLHVLHECDNPRCVNPSHLRLGTHLDNMRDMYSKGRRVAAAGERCGSTKLTTPSLALAEEFCVSARRVNQIRRAALKES